MANDEFLVGEGEMAALMRGAAWEHTPLGPPGTWPQSLKTTVRILLTSRYAMWMGWGPELTFLYNDAYGKETLGGKHPWALGQPAQVVWSEIWEDIGPRIEKVLGTGEATWDEGLLLFLERNGYSEETYHTFSYSPLANDSGTNSGILCVVTEVTQRILGERRLALLREVAAGLNATKTSAEVFEVVSRCIEANPLDLPFTLIYLFDAEGKYAYPVGRSGVPADHPIVVPALAASENGPCWPIRSLIEQRTIRIVDGLQDRFPEVPSGPWQKPPGQAALVPITYQGQERPAGFLIAGINPFRTFDADYQGFIDLLAGQIASGLSNVRSYEEERKRAEALAELDRAKTTFFSNVSHEFRTPLTLMLGPMEEALAATPKALTGEGLEIVHRNGLRLLKLVNTLLDFSRIEAGRVQARYEPTDLATVTADLASLFRSAVEKAGMELITECDPLPEPVYVDRDMWEKIVLNLLSNAFKFTPEGSIRVGLRAAGKRALLTVADTGLGIAEDQLPHIFERFHRVEGIRARTHEGTGIGLALVQELARLHGGTVRVESRLGVGTTFFVEIPLGKQHLPSERISAPSALSPTGLPAETFVDEALRWLSDDVTTGNGLASSLTSRFAGPANRSAGKRPYIVLADDNNDMREYVRNLLCEQYDILPVANGEEALVASRERRPDLILSDVMMPVLDGFEMLQALRGDAYLASVPVILLSARAGEEARIEGLSAGADDYLIKPFSARELHARIRSHLELSRVRREADQAIRESEERFRVALRNVPLTVFTCDRELRYTWIANPPRGLTAEEMIGKRDEELFSMPEVGPFIAFKERVLTTEKGVREELTYGTPGGASFYDMTAEPLFNRDGETVGLTVAAFDITSIKHYEMDLAAMNAQLRRAMVETHHRVKNNLQLIAALIEMQRESGADMVPISELTRLEGNVRALGVIHDILTREAKEGSDQGTLSARAVLSRLINVITDTVGNRPLKATFDDVRLVGRQATALALIANELVSNAVKYGKGEIRIELTVREETIYLRVKDDGPGFRPDFDPLTSANTGLELVDNVVRWDLRGTPYFKTAPDGGALVEIVFPRTLAALETPELFPTKAD